MRYIYTAVLSRNTDDPTDPTIYARIPDLDGCITTGKDLSDAIDQITDAASVWLCSAEDHGDPVVPSTDQDAISIPSGAFKTLIKVDTNAYRALTDTRSVRKNVSLPAWMAIQAGRKGINLSQVLQEALLERLDA